MCKPDGKMFFVIRHHERVKKSLIYSHTDNTADNHFTNFFYTTRIKRGRRQPDLADANE